ncbi:MAG: hypothetical protein ACERKD_09935 [Prolixibacteraceae bacterium]
MNIVRQNGKYSVYNGKTYRIDRSNLFFFQNKYPDFDWVLWGNEEQIPIHKGQVETAYKLETIAEVDNFECPLGGADDKGFYLFPQGKEAGDHFGVLGYHGATDRFYRKDEEIDNIFEVRTPIEGFPFKTEPKVYLKKDGVWLDESYKLS